MANTMDWIFRLVGWLGAGLVLVIASRLIFVLVPHLHFDSDQAIIGLMAMDIAEGKGFAFYYWGQTYLMAVEAWWASLSFWLFGATISHLKASILALNLLAYGLLFGDLLGRYRPRQAFFGLLPFAVPSILFSSRLVEAQGANIEPFIYVSILWRLRAAPLSLGIITGVFFVHREFVMYAFAALLFLRLLEGQVPHLKRVLFGLTALVAWWVSVALVRYLGAWLTPPEGLFSAPSFKFGQPLKCLVNVFAETFPALIGAEWRSLREYNLISELPPVSWGIRCLIIAVALSFLSVAWRQFKRKTLNRGGANSVAVYWVLTGLLSAVGYILLSPHSDVMSIRYQLLVLFLFMGAALLCFEDPKWRTRVSGLVLTIALWNGFRAVQLAYEQVVTPPKAEMSELIGGLLAQNQRVGWADYWTSYYVTFATAKKLVFATRGSRRTPLLQQLEATGEKYPELSRRNGCAGSHPIGEWYLCPAQ